MVGMTSREVIRRKVRQVTSHASKTSEPVMTGAGSKNLPERARSKVFVCGLDIHNQMTGGTTNSMNLISSLAQLTDSLYLAVFWIIGRAKPRISFSIPGVKVFSIPIIEVPWPLHAFVLLSYSLLYLLIAIVLKVTMGVNMIFVSDTLLAYAFLRFKKLHSIHTVVRFTALEEMDSNLKLRMPIARKVMTRLLHKIDQTAVTKADAIVAPSQAFAEVLKVRHREAMSPKRIMVIPPVIETSSLQDANTGRAPVRELRIGYVGSLLPYQGIDILLESMVRVHHAFPQAVLYVIGGRSSKLQIYRTKAEQSGFKAVFTGQLPHSEALRLLGTFHVLVIPRKRNFATELLIPMKILEAFALGIPVVVTRHRSLTSLLENRVHVLFIEPSPQDVSAAICEIIRNPSIRQSLVTNGKKVVQLFEANSNAAQLACLFDELSQKHNDEKSVIRSPSPSHRGHRQTSSSIFTEVFSPRYDALINTRITSVNP